MSYNNIDKELGKPLMEAAKINYAEEDRKWKRVVVAPGRFQPVHGGHEFMIKELIKHAKKLKAEPVILVIAGSAKSAKNPLSGDQRAKYIRDAFKGIMPVGAVAGSDRAGGYIAMGKYYNIPDFNVKKLQRDEEEGGSGVDAYSATKVRLAAAEGWFDERGPSGELSFVEMMPQRMSDAAVKKMYKDLRKALGVR